MTVLALFTVFYKGFRSNNSASTVDFVPEGVSIHDMRILLVGAGGVGSAIAAIAARRGFAQLVVADYDLARAQRAAGDRDGRDPAGRQGCRAVAAAVKAHDCDVLINATDPRFVMPIFRAALAAGADYLDMAMSLSAPHPGIPTRRPGSSSATSSSPLAGEWEGAAGWRWSEWASSRDCPMCSPAMPPIGCSGEIDEIGVRDGANLVVDGYDSRRPSRSGRRSRSASTPGHLGTGPRLVHHRAVQRAGDLQFPEGIGPVECVNVEHEEVLLVPRWVDAQAGHVQVRPRRRVHRRAARRCTCSGSTPPSRCRSGGSRLHRATW